MTRSPIVLLGKAPQCVVRSAAISIGDQRPISAFTRRAKLAGVLACLTGLDPPKSASPSSPKDHLIALATAMAGVNDVGCRCWPSGPTCMAAVLTCNQATPCGQIWSR